MSAANVAPLSKADYLKKYLSGEDPSKPNKKRRKKVLSKGYQGCRIIDDDVAVKHTTHLGKTSDVGESDDDNVPLVVGAVEDNSIKRDPRMWTAVGGETNDSQDISHHVSRNKQDGRTDQSQSQKHRRRHDSGSDQSPPRTSTKGRDSGKHMSQSHKSSKLHNSAKNRHESGHDQSPPKTFRKRHDSGSDQSPPRTSGKSHDSGNSQSLPPPRTSRMRHDSGSDQSPPRTYTKRHDSGSDQSPSRSSRKRPDSGSDQSPPRTSRKRGNSGSDQSPPRPSRKRGNSGSDQSPPRTARKRNDSGSDQPPPQTTRKRHDSGSDQSPPRTARKRDDSGSDESPPRTPRQIHDSRNEPPHMSRKRHDSGSDQSPPRTSRKLHASGSDKAARKRRGSGSDQSPPQTSSKIYESRSQKSTTNSKHRSQHGHFQLDISRNEGKHRHNSDVDPSIKKVKMTHAESSGSDLSPPRSTTSKHRTEDNREQSLPSSRRNLEKSQHKDPDRPIKTLSGLKAGLQNAKVLRNELQEARAKENEQLKRIGSDVLGKGAQTVFRDRSTGKLRNLQEEKEAEELKLAKENEMKAKYKEWGRGLKQQDEQHKQILEEQYEMTKPLARYEGDEDLERHLKEKEREGDPMLQFMRKKKTEGKPTLPKYSGPPPPPNRFNIMPGYRWDGVDRSNGFEKKLFELHSNKIATVEEAYRWSTENM